MVCSFHDASPQSPLCFVGLCLSLFIHYIFDLMNGNYPAFQYTYRSRIYNARKGRSTWNAVCLFWPIILSTDMSRTERVREHRSSSLTEYRCCINTSAMKEVLHFFGVYFNFARFHVDCKKMRGWKSCLPTEQILLTTACCEQYSDPTVAVASDVVCLVLTLPFEPYNHYHLVVVQQGLKHFPNSGLLVVFVQKRAICQIRW